MSYIQSSDIWHKSRNLMSTYHLYPYASPFYMRIVMAVDQRTASLVCTTYDKIQSNCHMASCRHPSTQFSNLLISSTALLFKLLDY